MRIEGAYTKPSATYTDGVALHIAEAFRRALRLLAARECLEPAVLGHESVLANDVMITSKWNLVRDWFWKRSGHINVLETSAAVSNLVSLASRRSSVRFCHLVDSAVARGALTKGRSPSRALQPLMRKAGAVCICADLYPAWGYSPTRLNVADDPTRCRQLRAASKLSLVKFGCRWDLLRSDGLRGLRRFAANWVRLVLLASLCSSHAEAFSFGYGGDLKSLEEEFLNEAMKAQHPLAAELALPHELREAILFNFNAADHEVVKHRAAFLAKWVCRAKQLSSDECSLNDRMDPKVASAVHNKRILVFKEMLIDTGFPDLGVVDELITGASLTGEVPATGMLPGKFTPAVATDAEIREAALRIRPKLDTDNLGSGDPIIDAEVWRKTLEEVERGWLQGPLTRSSVPGDQPISRRFGLLQKKGKVRLIDDFSESGVNSTVTSVESPVLHTIDVACAVLAFWFGLCNEDDVDPRLVIRTFDLTSAYRQVGLCQAGRDFACIRVFDPKVRILVFSTHCWELHGHCTLDDTYRRDSVTKSNSM